MTEETINANETKSAGELSSEVASKNKSADSDASKVQLSGGVTDKNKPGTGITNTDNAYGGTNTKDYTGYLERRYDNAARNQTQAIDSATNRFISETEKYQGIGMQQYTELEGAAQRDYEEAISTRDGIEANNGNRGQIGHTQYGQLEQAYNTRLAELRDAEAALKTQTIRSISEAKAQGDYEKANAMMETAQAKLRAIYEEQLRIDQNLRSNYEWQTELDQEDKQISAEEAMSEKEWQRSMGEALLKAGVMPADSILESMGISSDIAKQIIEYYKAHLYSGGGGGGGGGWTPKKSTTTSPSTTQTTTQPAWQSKYPSYTYNSLGPGSVTAITHNVYDMMYSGNYSGAAGYVAQALGNNYIDSGYANTLLSTIQSGGANSAGYWKYIRGKG